LKKEFNQNIEIKNPPQSPFYKGGSSFPPFGKACLREAASAKAGEGFYKTISDS